MARVIEVELVGDSRQLERAFKRSSQAASKFNRDVGKATRGVLAGSGAFRGFGRSIAFASGGFVAFASATAFLRASIDAAREAAVSQRSLAAQMKASRESFKANRREIERVSVSYGKFGFQNDEIVAGLTVLERGTGNIRKSFGLLSVTADLARAKQLDFAQAATVLAKVFGGQETALRRAVPGLRKNAHGWDLIRQAQQRLAGQAAANTTEAERFAATLHNTEEIIGTALLPTLNLYLQQLGDWLEKMNESGKLQRDVNTAAKTGGAAFHILATAVGEVVTAYEALQRLNKAVDPRRLFGDLPFGIGGRLHPRGDFGPGARVSGGGGNFPSPIPPAGLGGPITGRVRRPLGLQGRFNLAQLRLAQAQLTKTLADDQRILRVEQAIVERQIESATKLKDKTRLTEQLVGITGELHGIEKEMTDQIKEQNQALKDRAEAIKSALLDRLQQRQTNIENRRALQDARAQLRLARALGGPVGIRNALRDLQDVRLRMLEAQISAAQPSLRGGRFALGQVITINVHGVDSPEKVANQIAAILRRRAKHTSTQSRGPAAGA